jgi:hypothetical protein
MVREMDQKQREEFDATLSSGVGDASWAKIQAEAFAKLEAGEFDRNGGEG